MIDKVFQPAFGEGLSLTTSAASANTAIDSLNPKSTYQTLCLTNTGLVTVYVSLGTSVSVTASVADYPVLSGSQVTIARPADKTHLAHISPSGAGALHIIPGEGL